MGFFNKRKVNVSIRRGNEFDNESDDFDEALDRTIDQLAHNYMGNGFDYYRMVSVDGSRINGYIRECKIKKQYVKLNGFTFDYAPIAVGIGVLDIMDDNSVVHTSEKGTHRKFGYADYRYMDQFEKEFAKRSCCLLISGGPASRKNKDGSVVSTINWHMYLLLGGYKK